MYFSNRKYKEDFKNTYDSSVGIELLSNKKILITGATGLIGSFLVDFCLFLNEIYDYKIQIYVLGRDEDRLKTRFQSHIENNRLHFIIQDVVLPLMLESELDYIIHAAGDGFPAAFREHPVETMTPAFIGTYNLLEAARKLNVKRFMYISSGEIYGKSKKQEHAFKEDEPGIIDSMQVRSCYPIAKKAAETLCVSFSQEYGIDTVIARPGHTYGVAVSSSDNRATVQFMNDALNGRDIVLYSSGLQMRSYTYISDCASALLTVLLQGNNMNVYNIANSDSKVTIAEFAKILSEVAGVGYEIRLPDEAQQKELTPIEYAVLDSSKLERLGWKGKYGIRAGIEQMYQMAMLDRV